MAMTPTTPPPPTLDFAAIRSRCPKAFAALIAWFANGKYISMGTPTIDSLSEREAGYGPWLDVGDGLFEIGDFRSEYRLHPRDLYDFFDEQGVYVGVLPGIFGGDPNVFHVAISGVSRLAIGNDYPTRAAAEAAAFTAGFAKLEEMITKKES